MISTIEELKNWFWFSGGRSGENCINVSTKLRKDFLLSNSRNSVTINNGRVEQIEWKNLGGGVWQAKVTNP